MADAKRTYVVETYGCQMNVHDSERIAGLLEADGYAAAPTPETADVVVVNTCSVRERAEEKLYTRLGEIRAAAAETGHRPLVAVAGCVAQQEGAEILKRSRLVDVVVGTQAVKQLPSLVARAAEGTRAPLVDLHPHEDVSFPFGLTRRDDPVRAFVTIIEGCNEFCSFCVVPYTRGHERMRAAAEIVAEARHAAATGRSEVQLLGQIVNHYQAPDVRRRLRRPPRLVHEIDGIERIRFASPHPRHFTPRTVAAIRDLPKVCNHLHMPVQSGSTAILKAMRRRYTREEYVDLVASIRETMPDVAVSTDMIVGFPGRDRGGLRAVAVAGARRAIPRHLLVQVLAAARHPCRPALRRRRQRAGQDAPHRGAAPVQRDIQSGLFAGMVGKTIRCWSTAQPSPADEWAGRTHRGNTVVNFAAAGVSGGRRLGPGRAPRPLCRRAGDDGGPNAVRGVQVQEASC